VAHLVEAPDNVAAWKAGAQHLLAHGAEVSNIVLTVGDPVEKSHSWCHRYNPKSQGARYDNVRDVANTIFPARTYANCDTREEFYARYGRAHDRRRHAFPGSWGTYFERLTAFGESRRNQLENAIASMSRWTTNHRAAITLHISSPDTDGFRTRGGPCLQYIQVVCPTRESVDLVAVYRSHDYFNKTLGNLVGLGLLQQFIANQTGRRVGGLVCHSIHAFLGAPKSTVRALLAG